MAEKTDNISLQLKNAVSGKKGTFDFLNKEITLFGKEFPDKKKERFYAELNILLSAGVDIKSALELIAGEQNKAGDKELFNRIKELIVGGHSLSEALRHTEKFSNYEFHSLQIGEETGKLTEVLNELAGFYQKKMKQRRQFVNAMTYPSVVLLTAFGAVFFMMEYMVPMFADIFKRFRGGDIPAITQLVIHISELFRALFLYVLLLALALAAVLYHQRNESWFRKTSTALMLRIPVFGGIIEKIYLARFCQSMNLLISSRIPILKAISLVKQMISFYPIEHALEKVHDAVLQGAPLHQCLSAYPIFNKRLIALIKVGEEVNQLDTIFDKLAKQYNEEVEFRTSIINSLIEPVMIIMLGIIVGTILVAMYLPLFQLSTGFR